MQVENDVEGHEVNDMEHYGFFEPEVVNDSTYYGLLSAIKAAPHWLYSKPDRIEPVQGQINIDQLQKIIDQFEYESDDFFRGSISLWGSNDPNLNDRFHPNRLEIIYIVRDEDRFVVKKQILK